MSLWIRGGVVVKGSVFRECWVLVERLFWGINYFKLLVVTLWTRLEECLWQKISFKRTVNSISWYFVRNPWYSFMQMPMNCPHSLFFLPRLDSMKNFFFFPSTYEFKKKQKIHKIKLTTNKKIFTIIMSIIVAIYITF